MVEALGGRVEVVSRGAGMVPVVGRDRGRGSWF